MKFLARFSTQVCAALMVSVSPWCSGQTSYSITDLGTIHTNGYRVAREVNIAGEVTRAAGSCSMNLSEVFLYSYDEMSSLGTLGGDPGIGNGINGCGEVAGYSTTSRGT